MFRRSNRRTHAHSTAPVVVEEPTMAPERKLSLMERLTGHTRTHTRTGRAKHHRAVTTTARPARKSRLGFGSRTSRTSRHSTINGHHHHTEPVVETTAAPTRRRTSLGDKVSGAMMKVRGSLSGRPGVKAAGTRRMHGTDGRGARRYY